MVSRSAMLVLTLAMALAFMPPAVLAEEEAAGAVDASEPAAAEEAEEDDGTDETKATIKQLTISMVSEVVDAHHFVVRDSEAKTGKKRVLMKLGNTAALEKGSMDDEEHQAKKDAGKDALEKMLGKQMIWWKAAPEEYQPKAVEGGDEVPMLVDVYLIDGRHINTALREMGHLAHDEVYTSEWTKNILTADSDEKKKDSYKKLEEALKESEAERKRQAAEAAKEAEANIPAEPIGLGAWLGLACLFAIIVGAATNFGRGSSQRRPNNNRKKTFFEKFMGSVKGKSS